MTVKQNLTPVNFTKGGMRQIRGLVIHSMDGTYQGSIAWFKNPWAKASAHYLISESGEITQMVKDVDEAWHAGIFDKPIADWLLPNPNFFCLGIEFEDKRDRNWKYPGPQRKAGAWLVKMLMDKYNIPEDHIVLHKDLSPSRRSDPVGQFSFNWLLKNTMQKELDTCINDRNTNWDIFNKLMDAIGIKADPDNKQASTESAINSFVQIKARADKVKGLEKQLETIESAYEKQSSVLSTQLLEKQKTIDTLKLQQGELVQPYIDQLEAQTKRVVSMAKQIKEKTLELAKCQADTKTSFISWLFSFFRKL